ncbi:angiopoietin-related protein 7-like [Mizuhopecten yessoensis]|uniref:angiopoietin-related protein 7-like n=1 Tax=Mizuhopecten yessoensis TaxID=6573 RepID=UPI000B45E49D|nr:angiopoietin-related protein 7-like [Mizuhopecten yessoensis]
MDPSSLSGVYRITPVPGDSFDVYCHMESKGGPWTVIQNRESNEVDFFRNWDQYKNGFGNLLGNFWLGNEHIFSLTRTPCLLRIQLESLNGTFGYADYSKFQISDEGGNYKLSVTGFSGNISDSFKKSDGQLFSTLDRNNDIFVSYHCAEKRHGAWWYKKCTHSNLNGMYEHYPTELFSMYWKDFFGDDFHDPMKTSKMMLKKP